MRSNSPLSWLPQTKLLPPQVGDDVLPRPQLIEALHTAVLHHRLTLLAAPAGSGKTTAVALLHAQHPDLPLAWLTLDAGDNDLASFMALLLAGVAQALPGCPSNAQALLGGQGEARRPQQIIGALINDILTCDPEPFVLVLDDLHLIENTAVLAALDYLLDHLPPMMHLAATARTDPGLALPRLRARGHLAELRLPDLRFTLAEIDAWLNGRLNLQLSPQELQTVQRRVEGWGAGLQLLAASLAQRPPSVDRQRWLAELSHSRHVFDLLAEEVLQRQPEPIRRFLLQTAILEELTPELCTAVTQNPDAPLLLEEVYRRNLFLTAIAAGGPGKVAAYRYHQLFAQFLQRELRRQSPADIRSLHERAGDAHPDPYRAIPHLLAADAHEKAAVRLEPITEALFNRGRFDRLQKWILALPAAIRDAHPWLNFFLGVALWGDTRHHTAKAHLETALAGFSRRGDTRGQGEALVQLSIVEQTQGEFEPAATHLRAALDHPISPRSRCQAQMGQAWLALAQGALEDAAAHLGAALALAEQSGDEGAINICMMQTRFPFQCVPGSPALFRRLARLLARQEPAAVSPRRAGMLGAEMFRHILTGDLSAAIAAGEEAWHISGQLGQLTWCMVDTGFLLIRLTGIRGDRRQFDQSLAQYRPVLDAFPGWRRSILFATGYDYWVQGRLEEMKAAFAEMDTPVANEWPSAQVLLPARAGVLALSRGEWRAAETALRQASAGQRRIPVVTAFADMRLLLAITHQKQGDEETAVAVLKTVLGDIVPDGKPGRALLAGPPLIPVLQRADRESIHPETCRRLLAQLDHDQPVQSLFIPQTGETLTPREVEVLRLLATGASNRQIGEQLVIALPTVKTHVSRILRKLDVDGRTAAAARVGEWQLYL